MAKDNGLFNNTAIIPIPGKDGTIQQTFKCTLTAAGQSATVLATAAQGVIELNLSDAQDFDGASYVTVFGKSVHSFTLDCLETSDCEKGYTSEFATLANSLKTAIDGGSLPLISLTYADSKLTINGYVARIEGKFNPPFRYFTLHIQGTF